MHVRIRPLKLDSRRRDILSCRRYLAIHDVRGQLHLECHRLGKRWLRSAFCYRSERGLWGFSLWRKHCEAGEDTDYYKKPVFLTPVKEGPFYALKVGPALLTVTGGLKTDINFECLDADGKPIEGLYALGNCMGDITAVDYPINVAGNSHGRCITYGYLLGKDLAK